MTGCECGLQTDELAPHEPYSLCPWETIFDGGNPPKDKISTILPLTKAVQLRRWADGLFRQVAFHQPRVELAGVQPAGFGPGIRRVQPDSRTPEIPLHRQLEPR